MVHRATSCGQGDDDVELVVSATINSMGDGQVGWTDDVVGVGASDMVNLSNVMETGQRGVGWQSSDTGGSGLGNSRDDRSTPGFNGQADSTDATTSEDWCMDYDGDGPGRYTSGPNDGVRPRLYTCGRKNDGRSTGQAPSYHGSRCGD